MAHRQLRPRSAAPSQYAMIDPPDAERQSFTQVAEDDFEPGVFIEQPAGHQAKGMKGSFDGKSPGRSGEPAVSFVRLLPACQGKTRVEVEGDAELLDCRP